ncbi:MAG: Nucleoside diphosphate kinase [Mycoplasmataceae bacterium]|nr:MAG: Nucleoside diphosphate kinase [Mycoplasmataceae bacterium]
MNTEKTLLMIKPDATRNNFTGAIVKFVEDKGLKLIKIESKKMTKHEAEEFYQEHKDRSFFKDLIDYICSGMVVAVCLEAEDAVKKLREINGDTNPKNAKDGTIRKIYGRSIDENAVHGSDSLDSAKREINFFFKK